MHLKVVEQVENIILAVPCKFKTLVKLGSEKIHHAHAEV